MLGFPCNQFGKQEPGTDEKILDFVRSTFDVDFPMFSKIDVNGDGQEPLYTFLKVAQPGDGESTDITWNFEKFLVDKQGNVAQRFGPTITPAEVAEVIPTYL